MIERINDWWLRWINAEYANGLEFRIRNLEAKVEALNHTELALLKRLPKEDEKVAVKPRLSRPWTQRRAWNELTDGGRVHTPKGKQ